MDLIKCPSAEKSIPSSYRRCPFCEEEDRPRKVSGKRRGGHHVAERKHTHSAAARSSRCCWWCWSSFPGISSAANSWKKFRSDRANDVENVDPAPVDPTPVDPTPVDPTPVDPTPVDPTPDDPAVARRACLPVVEPEPRRPRSILGADGRDERRHDAEEGRQRPLRLHDPE